MAIPHYLSYSFYPIIVFPMPGKVKAKSKPCPAIYTIIPLLPDIGQFDIIGLPQ